MNPFEYILIYMWSGFGMYMIVRYLNHRKFQKDMAATLKEAVDEQVQAALTQQVEPLVIRLFEANVKDYLLESKVVDKSVQFRWTNKEKINGNHSN